MKKELISALTNTIINLEDVCVLLNVTLPTARKLTKTIKAKNHKFYDRSHLKSNQLIATDLLDEFKINRTKLSNSTEQITDLNLEKILSKLKYNATDLQRLFHYKSIETGISIVNDIRKLDPKFYRTSIVLKNTEVTAFDFALYLGYKESYINNALATLLQ